MCRMIGYLGGIILFMVLGVQGIEGYKIFYATAIINIICIGLTILFRILAKYFNGFWKVWWKRLQKQVRAALSCLSQYTQMPEYQITTVTTDYYGNKTTSVSTTNNTFVWGCIQCIVCAALTVLSPLIAAFILFCYIQAIVEQCRWRKKQSQKNEGKQAQIARQTARADLNTPLQNIEVNYNQNMNENPPIITYVPTYPMMTQGTYVTQTYVKTVFFANPGYSQPMYYNQVGEYGNQNVMIQQNHILINNQQNVDDAKQQMINQFNLSREIKNDQL